MLWLTGSIEKHQKLRLASQMEVFAVKNEIAYNKLITQNNQSGNSNRQNILS